MPYLTTNVGYTVYGVGSYQEATPVDIMSDMPHQGRVVSTVRLHAVLATRSPISRKRGTRVSSTPEYRVSSRSNKLHRRDKRRELSGHHLARFLTKFASWQYDDRRFEGQGRVKPSSPRVGSVSRLPREWFPDYNPLSRQFTSTRRLPTIRTETKHEQRPHWRRHSSRH